jgi:hypothetical protein
VSGSQNGRKEPASIPEALSELLGALGFGAMAKQARQEQDVEKQRLYASIILRQAPAGRRPAIRARLEQLGLVDRL